MTVFHSCLPADADRNREITKKLDALEKLAAESADVCEEELLVVKGTVCELLDLIAHEISALLALNDRRRPKTISKETLFRSKLSIRQLSSASHSRQAAKKNYDELARQLLIGMLLNYHNPDWNPLDPSTHRPDAQSDIVKLIALPP